MSNDARASDSGHSTILVAFDLLDDDDTPAQYRLIDDVLGSDPEKEEK